MILITLGSQKFQFNRLLKEIDSLIEKGVIEEEVIAQVGYSDYVPKYYEAVEFLDKDEFKEKVQKCNILITHGGTGAIMTGLKNNKKVIAVARRKQFGEHVDDHQMDIVKQFHDMGLIVGIYDTNDIEEAIISINRFKASQYKSSTLNIINEIEKFIFRG